MITLTSPAFRRALMGLLVPVLGLLTGAPLQAQQLLVAEGAVYFWRPGTADWRPIQPNATLAVGDAVYVGNGATAELLIGPNDFVRMTSNTQLSLLAQDAGLMQFRVASGVASFDLRSPTAGRIIEIDTVNAAFVVGGSGYYRVDVQPSQTRFVTRRGGRATLSLADGRSRSIAANEEIVVEGSANTVLQNRIVIETDTWDRWNDARSDYYSTTGIGVVWIDTGRREPTGRPPRFAPRWEHHDHPAPPGGWARPVHPPSPLPIPAPARPTRPPEADHRPPHGDRGDRGDSGDHRDRHDGDRGRPGMGGPRPEPSTPPVTGVIRPPNPAPVPGPVLRPAPGPSPQPAPLAPRGPTAGTDHRVYGDGAWGDGGAHIPRGPAIGTDRPRLPSPDKRLPRWDHD